MNEECAKAPIFPLTQTRRCQLKLTTPSTNSRETAREVFDFLEDLVWGHDIPRGRPMPMLLDALYMTSSLAYTRPVLSRQRCLVVGVREARGVFQCVHLSASRAQCADISTSIHDL